MEDGSVERAKEKRFHVENSSFELNEDHINKGKAEHFDKNTQLWDDISADFVQNDLHKQGSPVDTPNCEPALHSAG